MTESVHERVQNNWLFDGPVDEATVASWPSWMREHLEECGSCRALLDAERLLRQASVMIEHAEDQLSRRGPPTLERRAARRAAWRAPAVDDLISHVQPLPELTMRFEGSPLELRCTARGLRASHPNARELLVVAAEPDGSTRVLTHIRSDAAGLDEALDYQPDRGARVVAIAANHALESEHWRMWLEDAVAADELSDLIQEHSSHYAHVTEATIPPPLRSSLLRLQEDPLAPASPAVTALLKQASAAGRADKAATAAEFYRQAMDLSLERGDATGQIKAGIGIAMALSGLGFADDGDKALRWVVEAHTLDWDWAARVCQQLATDAMHRMDFGDARRWADQSDAISPEPQAWGEKLKASILFNQEEWSDLSRVLAGLADMELPALQTAHNDSLAVMAAAHQGHPTQAEELFRAISLPQDAPLEVLLHWLAVEVTVELAAGREVDWGELVRSVTSILGQRDGGLLSSWDYPPLLRLVEEARGADTMEAAASLMRLRFLDCARAASSEHRLLGLCRSPRGVLCIEPTRLARVRWLRMPEGRLQELLADARREVLTGASGQAVGRVADLLFGRHEAGDGPIWVGSDGLLAEAPVAAIYDAAHGDRGAGVSFRELVGHRKPPPQRQPGSVDIVSIADAQGNLPWASREVVPSEASVWARGASAVKECLAMKAPCGLLHIGVHSRRVQGVPQLLFHDGPMGPVEIEKLSLPGAPVVLLAGCFTAAAQAEKGVERSIADAFSRAGASAVIATRWAVEDRETYQFVRRIVEAWPFEDPAEQVALACRDLRRVGASPRCWAAPIVY